MVSSSTQDSKLYCCIYTPLPMIVSIVFECSLGINSIKFEYLDGRILNAATEYKHGRSFETWDDAMPGTVIHVVITKLIMFLFFLLTFFFLSISIFFSWFFSCFLVACAASRWTHQTSEVILRPQCFGESYDLDKQRSNRVGVVRQEREVGDVKENIMITQCIGIAEKIVGIFKLDRL